LTRRHPAAVKNDHAIHSGHDRAHQGGRKPTVCRRFPTRDVARPRRFEPLIFGSVARLSPGATKRQTSAAVCRNVRKTAARCGKVWTLKRSAGLAKYPANRRYSEAGAAHLKIVVSPVRVRVSPSRKPRWPRGFLVSGAKSAPRSLGTGLGTRHPIAATAPRGSPVFIGVLDMKTTRFPVVSCSFGFSRPVCGCRHLDSVAERRGVTQVRRR
jgi:hypothetical protein